ncbi:MAG: hypothetical protein KGD73_00060 [Candidatus Lokiarchaeota archaeon]|nr:hypothetical protein [Candidatus Lokiarchaeota archaeon]
MLDKFSISIPGRICILGDKVDLMEKPVIAATINLMMNFNFIKSDNSSITFYSHNTKEKIQFHLGDTPPRNNDLSYWSVLYSRLKEKINTGFYLEVNSNIPIGRGLATSAAISVGFLGVMNRAYDLKFQTKDIAELAFWGENQELGIQCGRMDQYSIAYGGVTFIQTGVNPKVELLNVSTIPMVIGDSLEDRKASSVLNRIKSQIKEEDPTTLKAFRNIEEGVQKGKYALINQDFTLLGHLMNQQQEQEQNLKADTEKIQSLCEASKQAGALGAKQMGAGGGGCMIALCPGKQSEVAKAIENAGGKAWVFNIFNY